MNAVARSNRATLTCGLVVALIAGASAMTVAAQETGAGQPAAKPAAQKEGGDKELEELVRRIDVGPYEVPELTLQRDSNYAHSPTDLEPFRHVTPYKEHFLEQMEYTGPSRAIPEPVNVESVKLGFIGPIEQTVSVATGGISHEEILGTAMLRGTELAIKHANERGGYRGSGPPFELVVRNDNGLWGASGNTIIDMAYRDNVWAILGTIDGANSHIAIRVALKCEVFMMNTGDTDPTFIETNIPWVARCIGDDRQMGVLLTDYLIRKMDYQRIAVIRASNRYGRFGVREIRDTARRMQRPLVLEMAYKVGAEDLSLQLQRIKDSDVDAIVHWGDAVDGARILNQMREMGMDQPYFACDRCVSDEFLEIAGKNAEGVICGYPWNPTSGDPRLLAFRRAYVDEYGMEPDTYAAHAYDGMNILIAATEAAGLNRAKIRDVVAHWPGAFPGVTGEIPFSAVIDDLGEVFLARVENGNYVFYSREDLEIPHGTIAPRDRVSRKGVQAK